MFLGDMLKISAAGMQAQGMRMRVIAENMANSATTGETPGADPYQRRIVTFREELDRATGVPLVKVGNVVPDSSDFPERYDPTHPAADANGYVKLPNVRPIIETVDLKAAQRAYEANLSVIDASKSMMQRTVDLLRS